MAEMMGMGAKAAEAVEMMVPQPCALKNQKKRQWSDHHYRETDVKRMVVGGEEGEEGEVGKVREVREVRKPPTKQQPLSIFIVLMQALSNWATGEVPIYSSEARPLFSTPMTTPPKQITMKFSLLLGKEKLSSIMEVIPKIGNAGFPLFLVLLCPNASWPRLITQVASRGIRFDDTEEGRFNKGVILGLYRWLLSAHCQQKFPELYVPPPQEYPRTKNGNLSDVHCNMFASRQLERFLADVSACRVPPNSYSYVVNSPDEILQCAEVAFAKDIVHSMSCGSQISTQAVMNMLHNPLLRSYLVAAARDVPDVLQFLETAIAQLQAEAGQAAIQEADGQMLNVMEAAAAGLPEF